MIEIFEQRRCSGVKEGDLTFGNSKGFRPDKKKVSRT